VTIAEGPNPRHPEARRIFLPNAPPKPGDRLSQRRSRARADREAALDRSTAARRESDAADPQVVRRNHRRVIRSRLAEAAAALPGQYRRGPRRLPTAARIIETLQILNNFPRASRRSGLLPPPDRELEGADTIRPHRRSGAVMVDPAITSRSAAPRRCSRSIAKRRGSDDPPPSIFQPPTRIGRGTTGVWWPTLTGQ
jgi:hypothetical protein